MAECQGPATATQFQTSTVTSTVEQVITTTEFTTVTAPSRFRRQDPSPPPPSPTSSLSSTPAISSPVASQDGITSVITNILTFTTTQLIAQTNSVPTLTLFAPCSSASSTTPSSTSSSSTPSTSSTTSQTRASDSSTSSASSSSDDNGSINDQPSSRIDDNTSTTEVHTTVQDGVTVIVSKFVTEVGGTQTTVETPIQTLLNTVNPLSPSERGGVIAGGVIGGLLIVIGLLTLIFFLRRRRLNQKRLMAARQKRLATPRHLLEDELAEPMRQWDDGSSAPLTIESSPRLLRPRGSSTGSLFRENVWPPPQEAFHDPIMTPHDLGSTVSLVMGPPPPESPTSPTSHRSSNDGAAVAVTTATAVGAGRRAIRAYDASSISSSSAYSYDNQQPEISHSRATSTDPLLPSNASPPTSPLAPMRGYHPNPAYVAKVQEATNQRSRAYRRSNLSESFTPTEAAGGASPSSPPSAYNRPSHSRRGYSAADAYAGSSPDSASEDSELLRAVLTAGSDADLASVSRSAVNLPAGASVPMNRSAAPTPLPDELPPRYDTIQRDA